MSCASDDVAPLRAIGRRILGETRLGWSDLRGRTVAFQHQPLGRHIDVRGVAGYYCDLRHKAQDAARFEDGLPRNPLGVPTLWTIPVAQAALGYWELALEGHDTHDRFLRLADRLLGEGRPSCGGIAWPCQVAVAKYGLAPGWTSGLGQGETISVMLRAHALTGREAYRSAALAGLAPLTTRVECGGVQRIIDGHVVLEEYPARWPVAVLNGWILALLGVHELATVTGDKTARDLFDASTDGLLALLDRYDIGWWTLYSLDRSFGRDVSKPFYQRIHPVLLHALALVRPDPALRATARRWEAQFTRTAVLRASANKVAFRVRRAATGG